MGGFEKSGRLLDLALTMHGYNHALLYGAEKFAAIELGLLGGADGRRFANETTAQLTPAEQREARRRDPQTRQVRRALEREAGKGRG